MYILFVFIFLMFLLVRYRPLSVSLSLYIYIYIYMYVYVYIYIYIYTCYMRLTYLISCCTNHIMPSPAYFKTSRLYTVLLLLLGCVQYYYY